MKKVNLLTLSVLLLAGVWGCSDNKVNSVPKSEPYTSKEAISRGDIVTFEKVYNLDKFEQFITNLSSKKADNIRVTSYTDEGDPIFKDLKFDGNVINYSYDTSNDAFGGSNTGVRTDTCSEVTSKKSTQGEIVYSIIGCTNNDSEIDYYLFRTTK
ncbi:DUF4362 domain-containing protein [Paenibacillus odorifer]|uniref:DUF4362 domain-containing protein n=1 Tax=Paenibacillus odorifer TaxID=189426 RepID=UPI0013A68B5B|nr:DUF4362 domain-containing protein [Paenibacillus odorifer]